MICAVEAFSAEAPKASQGSVEVIHHALGSTQDRTGSQPALGEHVEHFLLYHILGLLAVHRWEIVKDLPVFIFSIYRRKWFF